MTTFAVQAPTDAQLAYIASLCREQGWPLAAAVHSKTEASIIIGAIQASTYRWEDYLPASLMPLDDDDYEDVPF